MQRLMVTVDPYIGRALRRPPLIGGPAQIQTLVLPGDPVNMESPTVRYHDT